MISLFDNTALKKKEPQIRPFDSYPDLREKKPEEPEPEEDPGEEKEEETLSYIFEKEYQKKIQKAETILNTARAEAEKIKEEAFSEGKQEGYEAGYKDGEAKAYADHRQTYEAELDGLRQEIFALIRDMGNKKDKVLEKYMDDLKDIALAVAEKIIHTSLKSSSEIIKRMIISNTEKLKKTSWAKIYIGKEEPGISIQGDSEFIRELSKLSDNVKIVVMEEEPGTCIIELPSEIIDLSTGTQLENIRGILENARP